MRARRLVAAIAAAAGLAVAAAAPAQAITDGQKDNGAHPNVGIILFYEEGLRYRCSATLIEPTVVLTAAHCAFGVSGKTIMSFDEDIADGSPTGIPVATNPAVGYEQSGTFMDGRGRTWHMGQSYAAPDYSDFTDMDNWNDYAIIILDDPVVGITPATLAPVGYLDQFRQPLLNKTIFTTVGYGTHVEKPAAGPQKPTPSNWPIERQFAMEPGQKLTPQILQVNGNGNDVRGTGGSCFGDSGGPTFLNGYVVAVTSYGYTSNCRYIDGFQRVDLAGVQALIDAHTTN